MSAAWFGVVLVILGAGGVMQGLDEIHEGKVVAGIGTAIIGVLWVVVTAAVAAGRGV